MANPTPRYADLTFDPVLDGMTTGYYWALGPDRTIDWSISDGFSGEYWINATALQANIAGILSTFAYYANVKFNYVGYWRTPGIAAQAGSELNVSLDGSLFFPSRSIWAMGFFPDPSYPPGQAGDVFLNVNSQANYLSTYALGSAGWALYMHELGHALGLKHPHDSGGTGRPTLQQIGLGEWDIDYATVMSYRDDMDWNLRAWDPATPMILDVLALQHLYGKNMSTNAGDNFYTLERTSYYQTHWDAGGNDTVTAAGQQEGWIILLPNERLSTLVDTRAGFAAPLSDFRRDSPTTLTWLAGDYENAVGSNFADAIFGSDAPNYLVGNGGDDLITGLGGSDVIDGGAGIDTAFFSGARSLHVVSRTSTGTNVAGPDGSDSMTSVERLSFSDMGVALDVDGGAGMTAKLLGAAFGPAAVRNVSFVKIGLGYFDSGWTYAQVANLALDAALGPARSNASVFDLLYSNTVGSQAPPALADYWVGQLQTGTMTQAQLAVFAADMQINLDNIDLVGLASHGLSYAL